MRHSDDVREAMTMSSRTLLAVTGFNPAGGGSGSALAPYPTYPATYYPYGEDSPLFHYPEISSVVGESVVGPSLPKPRFHEIGDWARNPGFGTVVPSSSYAFGGEDCPKAFHPPDASGFESVFRSDYQTLPNGLPGVPVAAGTGPFPQERPLTMPMIQRHNPTTLQLPISTNLLPQATGFLTPSPPKIAKTASSGGFSSVSRAPAEPPVSSLANDSCSSGQSIYQTGFDIRFGASSLTEDSNSAASSATATAPVPVWDSNEVGSSDMPAVASLFSDLVDSSSGSTSAHPLAVPTEPSMSMAGDRQSNQDSADIVEPSRSPTAHTNQMVGSAAVPTNGNVSDLIFPLIKVKDPAAQGALPALGRAGAALQKEDQQTAKEDSGSSVPPPSYLRQTSGAGSAIPSNGFQSFGCNVSYDTEQEPSSPGQPLAGTAVAAPACPSFRGLATVAVPPDLLAPQDLVQDTLISVAATTQSSLCLRRRRQSAFGIEEMMTRTDNFHDADFNSTNRGALSSGDAPPAVVDIITTDTKSTHFVIARRNYVPFTEHSVLPTTHPTLTPGVVTPTDINDVRLANGAEASTSQESFPVCRSLTVLPAVAPITTRFGEFRRYASAGDREQQELTAASPGLTSSPSDPMEVISSKGCNREGSDYQHISLSIPVVRNHTHSDLTLGPSTSIDSIKSGQQYRPQLSRTSQARSLSFTGSEVDDGTGEGEDFMGSSPGRPHKVARQHVHHATTNKWSMARAPQLSPKLQRKLDAIFEALSSIKEPFTFKSSVYQTQLRHFVPGWNAAQKIFIDSIDNMPAIPLNRWESQVIEGLQLLPADQGVNGHLPGDPSTVLQRLGKLLVSLVNKLLFMLLVGFGTWYVRSTARNQITDYLMSIIWRDDQQRDPNVRREVLALIEPRIRHFRDSIARYVRSKHKPSAAETASCARKSHRQHSGDVRRCTCDDGCTEDDYMEHRPVERTVAVAADGKDFNATVPFKSNDDELDSPGAYHLMRDGVATLAVASDRRPRRRAALQHSFVAATEPETASESLSPNGAILEVPPPGQLAKRR